MESAGWSGAAAWVEKARKSVADKAEAAYDTVQKGDLEQGAGHWASWAKGAADRARHNLAEAAEKAAASDWKDTLGKVTDGAAKASASLVDTKKAAEQAASSVASSAKGKLERAGSSIGDLRSVAMSPAKMFQSMGIFMLGFFLTSLSFSFLPLLPIKPQKFSLLFALGSVTMLGGIGWLKGPSAFFGIAKQREKLPFSCAYVIGLLGTFWATLIARSYLFTAIFAFLQAFGLMYFVASFVPGGTAILNCLGRLSGRAARAVCGSRG
eukprot:TRINITY_DN19589_c0_g1_i1.p1 TRINITY_DN19589_c0_g1~~TRINITY_DN19589_c0_g1_i1.p1  ORF type:complete len:267 (-),score=59.87 TRINITY_DN19589_c0_g1_i1:89-889(-)